MNCATPAAPPGLVTPVRKPLSCHNMRVRKEAGSRFRSAAVSTIRQITSREVVIWLASVAADAEPLRTRNASVIAPAIATNLRTLPPPRCAQEMAHLLAKGPAE